MVTTLDRRVTADLDDEEEVVLFLIGMRVNHFWKLHQWVPMFVSMLRMLNRLEDDPELGLLGAHRFASPPDLMVVQYWESFEKLEQWARDPDLPHNAAWQRYNDEVGGTGDAGIWHETYLVRPDTSETVYHNMPPHGLGAAVGLTEATGTRLTAPMRLQRTSEDEPPVAPD